ncbi:hypothetical protein ACOMHN_029736 [Nucella lapillus]
MFLAGVLWIWAFTIPPATPAHQTAHDTDPLLLLLSRLERLEDVLADHQTQWREDKQVLVNKLHPLQGDVQTLRREKKVMRKQMEALQNSHGADHAEIQALQIQTRTLTTENQALKTELKELNTEQRELKTEQRQLKTEQRQLKTEQRELNTGLGQLHGQLLSTDERQYSLKDLLTQPKPDQDGESEGGDGQRHEEEDTNPIQHQNESSSPQHVRITRSDDPGRVTSLSR